MLNFVMPSRLRALLLVVLMLLPLAYAAFNFDRETGFTSLICFGPEFEEDRLPEVHAVPHAFAGQKGYDGQFYAQVAVAPALRHPGLGEALDNPQYRATRIFVPALSWLLGLGRPNLILQVYALINLCFYALLLGILVRHFKPFMIRDLLCVTAIMWSTGALISVRRALLDLPAATLTLWAACLQNAPAFVLMAAALLTRETSIFSLPAVAWPKAWKGREIGWVLLRTAGAVLPLAAWAAYVQTRLPAGLSAADLNIGLPFSGLADHLRTAFQGFAAHPGVTELFELLAPASLLVQAAYLFVRPKLSSPLWRMGVGFAVLFCFFTAPLLEEQIGYCRAVVPMTIAFNLMVMLREQRGFAAWFIAGNIGLAWGAGHMMAEMCGAF
ncbi:MAG: hypothetical protein JXB04_10360 [Kiritimatiellae bacterium]|nr:hypothetical protein [Kiritimatiellia bacterium]